MAFDYSITRDRKFCECAKIPGRLYLHSYLKIKSVGLENVPKEGAFIIACNHINYVDPALLLVECPRPAHFMAKSEVFENKIAAWALTHCNAFPVSRGRSDKSSIEYAVKLINDGKVIGIFPEGTRSKDLKPHEAKAGISLIAKQTKADILPCAIYCEKKKGFRRKVTIRYGELIKYDELGITEDGSTRELREAAKKVMDKIVDLWEEGHCE